MNSTTVLALAAVALATALARAGDDFDTDKVRAACPGIAAWKKDHPDTPKGLPAQIGSNPKLAARLHAMVAEDQAVRDFNPLDTNSLAKAFDRLRKVDRKDDKALRALIHTYGIPTVGLIGTEGMADFWLLVQHADQDLPLQQKVLNRFADGKSGASLSEVAFLTDRVRHNQAKPQLYGTQFESENGGPLLVVPIEDAAHLDERRESMGLMPSSDYECGIRAEFPEAAAVPMPQQ